MHSFFKKRLTLHQRKIMKYMKYVFNDHFVLVCTFLLGGMGLYYSQLVKALPSNFIWGYPIVLVIWYGALKIGKLATLIEPADKVFLLPKELHMQSYLKRSGMYSFLLPSVITVILCGFTMPLYAAVSGAGFQRFFVFLAILLVLKAADLGIQMLDLFQKSQAIYWGGRIFWFIGTIVAFVSGVYFVPWLGVIVSLAVLVVTIFLVSRQFKEYRLDWDRMVVKEQARLHRIYQFIHLFTDVPEITGSVKRRKWADGLLRWLSKEEGQTYFYLYSRSFVRGTEYSGLFIRLLLVGGVVLFFVADFWVSLGLALLFVYLIGFQLLPLYHQFDYMLMTHLYPVSIEEKKRALTRLLSILLLLVGLVFTGLTVFSLSSWQQSLIILGAMGLEVGLFVTLYVPHRMKKV